MRTHRFLHNPDENNVHHFSEFIEKGTDFGASFLHLLGYLYLRENRVFAGIFGDEGYFILKIRAPFAGNAG